MGMKGIIEAEGLRKTYEFSQVPVHALKGVDLSIKKGEMAGITGPSGSGKSTLLHILGLLDEPSGGRISINGKDMSPLGERERSEIRLRKIGYVFQHFYLIPELTAAENVALPAMAAGDPDYEEKSLKMLEAVGLAKRYYHKPSALSGGEQQRVAIARSMINDPLIIMADEPTANLDSANGQAVLELFRRINRTKGITVVLVTHEAEHLKMVDSVYSLRDGLLTR